MSDDLDDDPHDQRAVELTGGLDKWLADMQSIISDLRSVIATVDRLIPLLQADPPFDEVLVHALSTSALITYARCFATGSRANLAPKNVQALGGSFSEDHVEIMNIRNKFVAHSVNANEQPKTILTLTSRASGKREASGLLFMNIINGALNVDTATRLQELARALLTQSEAEAQRQHSGRLAALQGEDVEPFYSMPRARWKQAGRDAVGKARSRKEPPGDGPWIRPRFRDNDAPSIEPES